MTIRGPLLSAYQFLIPLFILFPFSLKAQYFSKSYSSGIHTAQFSKALLTIDSSYVVFGGITGTVLVEGLVIKLNRNGDTLFTSKYISDQHIFFEDAIEYAPDSSIFLLGFTNDTNNYNGGQRSFINRLDKNGNILWQKNYQVHDSLTLFGDFKIVDDTIFVTAKTLFDGYLLKLDLLGNLLAQLKFPGTLLSKILIKPDHSAIITGNTFANSSGILFKIDSQGNVLWSYSGNVVSGGFGLIQEMSNGKLRVECRTGNVLGQSSHSYIHEFDSLGNYLRTCFFDVSSGNYWFTGFSPHSNGALTITGSHYYSGAALNFKIEIDSAFQIIQCKTEQGYFGNYCLLEIDQNHELMCGAGNIFIYNPLTDNCHFADTISTTNVGQWVFPDFLTVFQTTETPDVTITTSSWTKESGLTVADDCISLQVQSEDKRALKIFPNPASGKLYIINESSNLVDNVRIVSMEGTTLKILRNVSSDQFVDVSELSQGIYFVSVFFDNGIFQSSKLIIQ